jgi:hypothetical protein
MQLTARIPFIQVKKTVAELVRPRYLRFNLLNRSVVNGWLRSTSAYWVRYVDARGHFLPSQ